jgi:hypothetical protein
MAEEYVLREVRLHLSDTVTLIADVKSFDGLKALIKDAANAQGLSVPEADPNAVPKGSGGIPNDPARRIETRAGLQAGSLDRLELIAFKDNVPQVLRPGALSVVDAVLLLIFAVETGLQKTKLDYDVFKSLYEAQNIKSGSPLAMRVTDLRTQGYIDKAVYTQDRSIRLTAKGEKKAIEVLKKASTSK